jgi:diacylglycerol O-acyltransferase / wax synthase
VRELALAPPPTDEKLAEQVARIFSRPLDRARPLWEVYVIHGLADGLVAVMTKIHHAVIDGMSGAEIMGVLLDLEPSGRELPEEPPASFGVADSDPGELEMLTRGLLGLPRYAAHVVRALPSTLPNIEDVAVLAQIPGATTLSRVSAGVARLLRGGGREHRVLERSTIDPPRTSFNGRVSPHRRFAFGQLPLDAVKAVKNAHGCTVNDVVLSVCAGAVRRWLIEHDDLPEDPLVAQVPVSVRSKKQMGTYGNRIGMLSVPLFTNEADPVRRLLETHGSMLMVKEKHNALPAQLLQDATEFIPPAVFSQASRITFSLAATTKPIWNLVVSNVPGPQFPLYMAGAKLVAHYPVSVITDGMGLNITVMSYNGSIDVGIVADREQMRDVWMLIPWLEESLAELVPEQPDVPAHTADPTRTGPS